MDPKIRQLRAFALAYRLGSLTLAADAMHLTPSAVSQLTQQLEQALSVRLFDRTTRALRPTEAAHEAIALAEKVLADIESLKSRLLGVAERQRGTIRLACTPSFASMVMPSVIKAFVALHPGVRAVMRDAAPDRVMEMVMSDAVEFGILMRTEERHDAEFTLIRSDSISVVCRPDSVLAERQTVSWSDLADERIIAIDGGSGLPALIEQTLAAQGKPFEPAYDFAYLQTAVAMAAEGLGVLLLPSYLVKSFPEGQRLVALQLVDPVVPRHLYLLTKKGCELSPAGVALTEMVVRALE
jgi:DNA-binding transcriptional LysR family regulator